MIGSLEMSQKLGVTKETLERWANSDKVPGFKIGRFWKFDEVDVIRALKLASGNKLQQALGRISR